MIEICEEEIFFLVEEDEDLLGEGAPESEEEETDICFPEVEDDGDESTEQMEVGDDISEPPLVTEEEEPLGLDRSVNGWRSARLALKPRVSYLGMC